MFVARSGFFSPSCRKYFSSTSLARRKATSCFRRLFRSSSVWMLDSPTMGAFSVHEGTSVVDSARRESSVNFADKLLGRQIVPIADDAGESDLARDAVFQRPHARGHRAGIGVGRRAGARDERERHAIDFGIFRLELDCRHSRHSSCGAVRARRPARREVASQRPGRPGCA